MIKKIFTIFIILGAVAMAAFAKNSNPEDFTTFASTPDLQITWQNTPLFTVSNMLPGDSITRSVTVKNISSNIQPLGIRAVPTRVNPDSFPSQMELKIMENGNTIRNYNLDQFIIESRNQGFVKFINLNPGNSSTYSFIVTFNQNSPNTYQRAQVIFDLVLGLAFDLPKECQAWAENPNTRWVFGTNGKDVLTGKNYPSVLIGFDGHDILNGNNQQDCLIGGDGNDRLHGNNKNDVLIGGNGYDTLFGGHGMDICILGEHLKTCEY